MGGRGPAASLNAAAATARDGVLVFVEAGTGMDRDTLLSLAAAAQDGVARIGALPHAASGVDVGESLPLCPHARTVRDTVVAALECPPLSATAPRDPRAWAVARDRFASLGGLDERFWLFGAWADLAHRVSVAGGSVRAVEADTTATASDAYPFNEDMRTRLAWHNALALAYLHGDADRFGSQLAVTSATALAESWHASGLDATTLRFGARWSLTVADERATLLPLLALDAFARGHMQMSRLAPRTWPLPDADVADRAAPPAKLEERSVGPVVPPFVSVIIVNWNGKEHLDACFSSLSASDYPADRLELLCVDNGSTDGSTAHLAARFPTVRVVALSENRGFTGGNEAGVAASRGDVLVFLNNDMRVEPDAIRRLVDRLGPGVACTAARVLSWNGRAIDFIRGTINFEGRGYQEDHGEPSVDDRSTAQPTFFPNGGAFAVTRQAYDRSGGFDPGFFAYYDDVDLGWRLRIVGSDIQVVKEAVVYHRHGATGKKHPRGQKRYLLERNALWTVFKCYGTAALRRTLGAALLLATRRVLQDVRSSALGVTPGFDAQPSLAARPSWKGVALESYAALAVAASGLPHVSTARRWVHARRATPDTAILPTFGRALEYSSRRSSYMALHDSLSAELALPHVLRGKPRVLIITHESLKRNMSGPAIRALELGRALGRSAHVTVAAPGEAEVSASECVLASYTLNDHSSIRVLAERADILVVWGLTIGSFPFLRQMPVPLVIDLYCPFTLEHLEMKATHAGADAATVARESASLLMYQNELLDAGDFFICASERQRDFWLGALHTAGRINTHTYAADATLRQLIDVVPFGLPDEPIEAAATRAQLPSHVLKGRYPGIGPDDRVLLWGGSMLDWQDPEVLIKAVAVVARTRRDVKLFFLGTKHPNPQVVPQRVVERSRVLARELGLLDTHVFFNEWVPYDERAAYLLDADIGVSTHRDHLETRFAFRTRMLDYMWARLPIVCTAGDHFGDLVQREGLGRAVAPGDPHALATSILELLDDTGAAARCRERLGALARDLRWSQVVRPLERYVDRGGFAPDHDRVVQAMQRELRSSYKWTKWAKRTALALGIGEGPIERVKGTVPVRAAMALRNRAAHWKAARKARKG